MLLLAIGFVDLVTTALLHANGLIVEKNPLMKPIIETSEWLFAFVKGATLVVGYLVISKYFQTHLRFIRKVCQIGSLAYLGLWVVWFVAPH